MRWSVLGLVKTVILISVVPLGAIAQMRVTTATPVDIFFDDVGDFQNGVFNVDKSVTITAGVVLPGPRDLNVATASNLTRGAVQIPASIVRLTSVGSPWTNRTVFLNTASTQVVTSGVSLLSGQSRTYTLRYAVPPSMLLFNRPTGIYSTTLTYHVTGSLSQNATATVNLHIQNVLAISSNYNPVFSINTIEAFTNGISLTQSGALTVSSTLDYDINVRALGPFSSGSRTIPANHLSVAVLNAGGTVSSNIPVTTTGSQLVNEGSAALSKALTVRYQLAGGAHLLNLPTAAYSTTLTYTISAD